MNCPLTKRCHGKLSEQLTEARKAHSVLLHENVELRRENSVLEWRLNNLKIGIGDLTSVARKKRSGYVVGSRYCKHNCGSCNSVGVRLSYDDKPFRFCEEFQHRVDKKKGSCNFHSDLIELEKKKVA